jgi:hypothetical protein
MNQGAWPEIMLFMQTEILSGSIIIATPEGRLLDELNGRIISIPENRDKFMILNNVIIQHLDGRQDKTPQVHVNKDNVQMAATSSINTSRGIGGNPGPKPYPFTEKVMVRVKMVTPSYEINGNMYRTSHQNTEHVLIEKTRFVPVTDAEVNSLAYEKRWVTPFLAVNKAQILSIHECNYT